jgi:hypothetical protein
MRRTSAAVAVRKVSMHWRIIVGRFGLILQ